MLRANERSFPTDFSEAKFGAANRECTHTPLCDGHIESTQESGYRF
jgi:hypothetical protein